MRRTVTRSYGYSIIELLVVVAILGMVILITVPALTQLMPQYRIRSAASETAAAVRMIRQRAVATRTPHRISFDLNTNRYYYSMLTSPNADMAVEANWLELNQDGRNRTADDLPKWVSVTAVQLDGTANSFKDVACPADGYADLIFLRDGSVSNKAACGAAATAVLTFTPNKPAVVFSVDSSYVRYNHYYISVAQNGVVSIQATKE